MLIPWTRESVELSESLETRNGLVLYEDQRMNLSGTRPIDRNKLPISRSSKYYQNRYTSHHKKDQTRCLFNACNLAIRYHYSARHWHVLNVFCSLHLPVDFGRPLQCWMQRYYLAVECLFSISRQCLLCRQERPGWWSVLHRFDDARHRPRWRQALYYIVYNEFSTRIRN